jgi:hypothetical protein
MQRRIDRGNQALHSIPALMVLFLWAPKLICAESSSGSATLVVEVRPDVRLELAQEPFWNNAGEQQSLSIQLKVLLRINQGTYGQIAISSNGTLLSEAALLVETEEGLQPLTATPIVLRNYSGSGAFEHSVHLQRAASAGGESLPDSFVIEFLSSDGAIAATRVIQIPPAGTAGH